MKKAYHIIALLAVMLLSTAGAAAQGAPSAPATSRVSAAFFSASR